VDVGRVRRQAVRPVRQRVARVDDLDDDVGALQDAPQLAPDLEVALKGGEDEALVLLQLGEAPAGCFYGRVGAVCLGGEGRERYF
jgi:hypothetical protein